jgi:phage terminase Nu1 subunit (DNA packaging protein)|tara:strand:+ start:74 stop:541 length:468 start_codon:yes stop_codon:yes gene_type:complete
MATLSDCASHLGIDQSVLSRLIKESVLDKQDRGKYDVDAVRLQYLKHIRNLAGNNNNNLELGAERARLAKEQADAKEMENAVERGDLVYIEKVARQFEQQLTKARNKLLAAPTKVAAEAHAAATVKEVREIIEAAIIEALDELVGYNKETARAET